MSSFERWLYSRRGWLWMAVACLFIVAITLFAIGNDSRVFQSTDWTQFVPDVLGAIVTGIFVGAVLVLVDHSRADAQKREQDRAWGNRLFVYFTVLSGRLFSASNPLRFSREAVRRLREVATGVEDVHPEVAAGLPQLGLLIQIHLCLDMLSAFTDQIEMKTSQLLSGRGSDEGEVETYVRALFTEIAGLDLTHERTDWRPAASKNHRLSTALTEDAEFRQLVLGYIAKRRVLFLCRNAYRAFYVELDAQWEALLQANLPPRTLKRQFTRRKHEVYAVITKRLATESSLEIPPFGSWFGVVMER